MLALVLILAFNFFSFSHEKNHVEIAEDIHSVVCKRLEQRYAMQNIGDYWALYEKINGLGFRFRVVGPKSKEELRAILVGCAEELVNAVNQTPNIEKYLEVSPFTYRQVSISIFLYEKDGGDIYYPLISTASLGNGEIYYATNEKGLLPYKSIEYESYEDALRLVKDAKR